MVYRPTRGEIYHRGRSLSRMRSRRDLLAYRGDVPMVFQDPYGSLSPVYHVAHGPIRALKLHRPELSHRGRVEEAERLFEAVGLIPGRDFLNKYPYELSGGQRQRVGFAQALASRPELILADEPVSMLDVSVRIGVLNLMSTLRRRERISFLYITHDIASARYVADRLVVMYAGQVAESGPVEDVLAHPKHPYTQLLLSAVPDPRAPVALPANGEVQEPPRVIDPGEGCRFRGRCPYAIAECSRATPRLRLLRPAHEAACHVASSDLGGEVRPAAHL
jgi:peptide/nickel transport system ATP-binding protein